MLWLPVIMFAMIGIQITLSLVIATVALIKGK